MAVARTGSWRWWIAATVGVMVAVVSLTAFASTAFAQPEKLFRFGPDGTDASNFMRLGSVAIDQQSGLVYALDGTGDALFKFALDGEPVDFGGANPDIDGNRILGVEPFDPGVGNGGGSQVAVNSSTHVIYVTEEHSVRAFEANGEPAVFTEGPGAGTNEIPGFTELKGVAVDSTGNIYASDNAGTVSIYAAAGGLITSFAATEPLNLSIDPAGAVYVNEKQEAIKKYVPSSFPISGGTTYAGAPFVSRAEAAFINAVAVHPVSQKIYLLETNFTSAWIRIYDSSGTLLESIGEPGTPSQGVLGGASEGLALLDVATENEPQETLEFYTGDSGSGNSKVAAFGTREVIAPPEVTSLRVTDLTADSARLRASVDPNLKPTTYRFEYGPEDCDVSACTSVPLDGQSIGEGAEPVAVTQLITGLTPATEYHYRIVASNVLGDHIEEGQFTTQGLGIGFDLSDRREWEMVSPPNKQSATLVSPALGLIQAGEDGNSITYLSRGSVEAAPDGNRNLEAASILAKRSASGWNSKDITPANVRTISLAVGQQSEYKMFSPDLSRSLLEPRDGTALSPEASERTPYLRAEDPTLSFTPLVTGKEGYANVPPGTEFGGSPLEPVGDVSVAGANESLTEVVLMSEAPLAAGAPAAPLPALYHWEEGILAPVSVLPEAEGGGIAAADLLGSGSGSVHNAISEDGTRVFWSRGDYGLSNGIDALFLRDTEAEETIRLDVVQPGAPGLGPARPVFQGANPDGTVVIFKDSHQLTEGSSPEGSDLYRCAIPAGAAPAGCASLINITAPDSGGDSAEVIGLVSGIADDATSLYFVAKGVLDDAQNQLGDNAEPGVPNLYHWQEGEGVRFIASLSDTDDPNWGGPLGNTFELSASVSSGGQYLAFMSDRSLTGQGNRDAETGNPVQQVFLYNAEEDRLTCVSCSPLGAAPTGEVSAGFSQMVDPNRQWEGQWVTAILPQPTIIKNAGNSSYQPRAVLDNGRVFFNTLDALASVDTNHQWDIYQFEPLGLGSCSPSSGGSAVVRSGDGCISLISSGTADDEAVFLDASPSGDDAFFLTPASLSVVDKDLQLDVYDARVDGIAAKLTPVSECVGQSCQSSGNAPEATTPASSVFVGPGNLKPRKKCPKGKRKVRRAGKVRCVAKKKQQIRKRVGSRGGQSGRWGQ